MNNLRFVFVQHEENKRNNRECRILQIRRHLRDASDPFSILESEFCSLYRFSREAVRVLVEDIQLLQPNPRRRHAVPVELQVLTALNILPLVRIKKNELVKTFYRV